MDPLTASGSWLQPLTILIEKKLAKSKKIFTNDNRMVEVNGRFRCDKPGSCPGQTEKVLELKKKGAEILIIGTCED